MGWIARLGGYLGKKLQGGPPGMKTTWLGYQRRADAARIYELLQADMNSSRLKIW
jgi:hypothetical protein